MLISILHRATGDGMAMLGGIGFVWWLHALSSGAESYATFMAAATHPLGYALMIGLSWAFFQHLCSGIRHLVLDIGAGYELQTNRSWSRAIIALSLLLTIAFWAWIFYGRGA